jgi:hypothetical protein
MLQAPIKKSGEKRSEAGSAGRGPGQVSIVTTTMIDIGVAGGGTLIQKTATGGEETGKTDTATEKIGGGLTQGLTQRKRTGEGKGSPTKRTRTLKKRRKTRRKAGGNLCHMTARSRAP